MPSVPVGEMPERYAVDEMSGLNRHARRALKAMSRRNTKLTRKIERLESKVNEGEQSHE